MSVEASISKELRSKRRGAFRALPPSKKHETQQSDIQPVAANRNLERDFFQKVNGFFQKVNAFLEKVNAFFQKVRSASRRVTLATKGTQERQIFNWSAHNENSDPSKYIIGVRVGLYLRSFGEK